jgi:integrase
VIRAEDVAERGLVRAVAETVRIVGGTTKSHAVRRVPLTPTLANALEAHLDRIDPSPDALLFTAPEGGPLVHSNFYQRLWRPALRRAKLPRVGVHVLRHSAAAALIASGASAKAVQTISATARRRSH